jgi:2-polyprenyl-3-methyl-5-hydroxy-6-metoxy-1,4-benzoquinol methylase
MTATARDEGLPGAARDTRTCSVCGSALRLDVERPFSTYARRGTYGVATCTGCACGQTTPRPSARELTSFYEHDYKYDAHTLIADEKRWRARRILDLALESSARAVLDVGCMYGYLLDETRARGARLVTGIELSEAPAEAARAKGHDVFGGTIEAFAAERKDRWGAYDLIVAQHVLEHVSDLGAFLDTAHRLLAPGGRLCLCVPNFGARTRRVFREAWAWYQVPVHLHHFGAPALERLLSDHAFSQESAVTRGGDSLFVLLTVMQGLGHERRVGAAEPSAVERAMIRVASTALRPYYYVGDDELLVIARRRETGTPR